MKNISVLFLLSLIYSFSAKASAANIYHEGSLAQKMYAEISALLPAVVIPIFVLAEDRTYFAKQIDKNLMDMQGISVSSATKAVNSVNPALATYAGAYTSGGFVQQGKESEMRLCEIVFTSLEYAKSKSTLFHEAMHCKTAVVATSNPYISALIPAFKLQRDISANQFKGQFEEAMAAALQVAYAANYGRTEGLDMVKRAARLERNAANSIGWRTARIMLNLCSKPNACSTDTMAMLHRLTSDKVVMGLLIEDFIEKSAYLKSNGIRIAGN